MAGLGGDEAKAALGDAYQGVTGMIDGLGEPDFLLPTHCLGWTVSDVLYHLFADARRALATLAPYPVVATQGHALAIADFAGTLAVEATIHHLDMIACVPAAPGPAAGCLALVRRTLDGLLGVAADAGWDDTTYALKGTGRQPLSAADRSRLGCLAGRFPLLE